MLDAADGTVRIERAGRNLGYGTAVNRGAALLTTPFVLVVNPDIVLDSGRRRRARDEGSKPSRTSPSSDRRSATVAGAAYPSARSFPSFSVGAGHAFVGSVLAGQPLDEAVPGGAAPEHRAGSRRPGGGLGLGRLCLVRREAFESVGGFDEGYFMYVEDLDLCWRLRRAGWRVLYEPAADAVHHQGLSTAAHPYRMLVAHHRSTLRFARKSFVGVRSALLVPVAAGLVVRLGLACVAAVASRADGVRRPSGLD